MLAYHTVLPEIQPWLCSTQQALTIRDIDWSVLNSVLHILMGCQIIFQQAGFATDATSIALKVAIKSMT
jgi:hypothetical protein